jgi:hypothetical protein
VVEAVGTGVLVAVSTGGAETVGTSAAISVGRGVAVSVTGRKGVEVALGNAKGAPATTAGEQEERKKQRAKSITRERRGNMRVILHLLT